jgi:hypothetical protein
MAYKHGAYSSEVPTSILPPTRVESGLPVIVGCAPVHMAADGAGSVNKPVLAYTYAEAVAALGYHDDHENFDLSEALFTFFSLYNVGPLVLINVLDPATHKTDQTDETLTFDSDDEAVLSVLHPVASTVVVKASGGGTTYVEGTDYTFAINDEGFGVITKVPGGSLSGAATIDYSALDPSAVTADDVVGGIDVASGAATGLELVNSIFPLFRIIPGQILAPRFGTDTTVGAVLEAKAGNINNHFTALALADIPTDASGADQYTKAPAWKNDNGFTAPKLVACWPRVGLGSRRMRMSLHVAAVNLQADADSDGIPYRSPSNLDLQADSLVLADGSEVVLGPDMANYLNGQGIVTGLNFIGGWKVWGNRTSAYPGSTDPKDTFIPIRRMNSWVGNTLVTTFWQRVDFPLRRRLIETVTDSANIWINGLTAREYLLGGRVEFQSDENPATDLMDGIARFHVYLTPPSPARELDFVIEYDPQYLETLFG